VKAADDWEKARYAPDPPLKSDVQAELEERRIDAEYNAQFVKAREEREKARAEFRQEVIDAVWEHSGITNGYEGEWTPEFYVPRGHEKAIDEAIDAAAARLLRRLGR
jgi:hypothetical protein